MRDFVIFLAAIAGAVITAVIAGNEHWLGDQPGLVVLLYLGVVFAVIATIADRHSRRRR